jgi:hypothetical protein
MAPLLGWDQAALSEELDDCYRQAALREHVATTVRQDAEAGRLAGSVPPLLPLPWADGAALS